MDVSDKSAYRNLFKTMGALGNEERVRTFEERFKSADPFSSTLPFHFGSHYSSPAIVLQYLIRL